MRLHRFYITEDIGNNSEITINSADLVHQVRRVFRLKIGDTIIIFNGTGFDYECKIDGFGEENKMKSDSVIILHVVSSRRSRYSPKRKLFLCAAIVKKDIFEWMTEKATELGVTDIIPVAAEHSEKKALNEQRLEKIAIEASEQSGRGTTPMVHAIMGSGEAAAFLKKGNSDMKILAFHTEGEILHRADIDKLKSSTASLAVFIGPEGGWSDEEIDLFHKLDISIRSLGPQVLRAETAVVAALSQVVFDN